MDRATVLALWQECNSQLRVSRIWFAARWMAVGIGAVIWGIEDPAFTAMALLPIAAIELVFVTDGAATAARRDRAAMQLGIDPREPSRLRIFAWNPAALVLVALACGFGILGIAMAF